MRSCASSTRWPCRTATAPGTKCLSPSLAESPPRPHHLHFVGREIFTSRQNRGEADPCRLSSPGWIDRSLVAAASRTHRSAAARPRFSLRHPVRMAVDGRVLPREPGRSARHARGRRVGCARSTVAAARPSGPLRLRRRRPVDSIVPEREGALSHVAGFLVGTLMPLHRETAGHEARLRLVALLIPAHVAKVPCGLFERQPRSGLVSPRSETARPLPVPSEKPSENGLPRRATGLEGRAPRCPQRVAARQRA